MNVIFKQLIAIHITDYFPKNGIIRTRYSTDPSTWLRDTVHFSLNESAGSISAFSSPNMRGSSWSNEKFAILIPFDKLYTQSKNQLQTISVTDTYFLGNITIPPGSVFLVLGHGISDAIHNGITTQDEVFSHFGDMSSPAAKKKTVFYVKKINGVEYIIYNYWENGSVGELVKQVVVQMGFSTHLNIPWRILNDALGPAFKQHSDHWTSDMEDFGALTKNMEEIVDYIFIFLKRLKSKGVTLPLVNIHGDLDFSIHHDNELTDAKRKKFRSILLYQDFSHEELEGAQILGNSLIYSSYEIKLTLQLPLRRGLELLQRVPVEYHKTIQTYLRSYQAKVKKQLPKEVITLCPSLLKLLEQSF